MSHFAREWNTIPISESLTYCISFMLFRIQGNYICYSSLLNYRQTASGTLFPLVLVKYMMLSLDIFRFYVRYSISNSIYVLR